MRGLTVRLTSCGLLLALSASLVVWGGHAATGQPGGIGIAPPAGKKDDKDKKADRSALEENWPFATPSEREPKARLKAARDYLAYKEPPYNTICPLLQNILDAKSDSFFDAEYTVGGKVLVNRISVRTEANRIIAAFKPDGLQFYQQTYGATAAGQLDAAIGANFDVPMLSDVSQRYFHTRAGAEATVLLGTLYLERGNYLEAAYAFERLLPRTDVDDVLTPRTLFKAALAFRRSPDPRHAELLKELEPKLFKAAKDGIKIGRTLYTPDKLRAEIDRPVALLRASALVGEWTMQGGNPARDAVVDGGPPFLDKVFGFPMFYSGDDKANLWIKGELEKLFARDSRAPKSVPLPGTFPVTTADTIMFRSYDGVYGVATKDRVADGRVVRAGDILWRSKTTAGLYQLISGEGTNDKDMGEDVESWWNTYNSRQVNVHSILYENPLIGSLAHDGQNVYFVDDIAITPPPVFSNPQFGINAGPQFRQSGDLGDMVRAGRLAAVDVRTGNLKWELGRVKVNAPDPNAKGPPPAPLPPPLTEEQADTTTDAFRLCLDAVFLSPPLPLNGKLYVLIEQAGVVRLICLDPKNLARAAGPDPTPKPTLVWSQKLGKPNSTLPTDSVRRFQGATLAAGEGIIVCPTNAGVVVAVDTMSRSLLWAHGYRNVSPAQNTFDPRTGQPVIPEQLPTDRWRAAGPVVHGGRVVLTAYDSRKLECLDLRTGKVKWSLPHDSNDLYVGGVVGDRVIVVGKNQVKAYRLTGEDAEAQRPKVAWEPVTIPTPTGHGAPGRAAYYVPVRQETAGRDAVPAGEIWAINVETGKVASKTGARKRNDTADLAKYGIGNLVFQDGMVFSQSPWEVAAYPQLELKIAEMNKLLDKNPNDPLGLLARGELRLDDGKLKAAVADFKSAEANGLPPEKRPLLREKLYIAYTEIFRTDIAAAEGFLKEYEALCELPAERLETPEDKARRDDETKRRKRLYYYLLARGRETQGRLGEAFDHYLALAGLGEGKQLLEMPDEPNVRVRPDVWARGRIESMIRHAATPAARKSLEARVDQEWDAVKGGTDLKKLREFVAVFGPFFASGTAAQFKLADVLLSTNNDADAREAQTHLSELRSASDDPAVRARATEALAQLMIKNRMMEDAVGLYVQLGKEYPDVVVRDGKTGADFLTDLLTDKRLLPFLEPSRFPLPTRVKAEQRPPAGNVNYAAQFEIESPPDLFPAFRAYRFALDQNVSGNGTWALRGFDRATGAERVRFPNLQNPNMYSRTGVPVPYSRFVQGSGHVMLVQLGMTVYCLDLAEKKELWHKALLDNTLLQPGQSYQIDVLPDGECDLLLPNGVRLPVGRSAVLQASYCALLTADGLEAVDPLTRRVQWVRTGVPEKTHLYGDGRYLVLVETDNGRKPVSTKLLRAVDGMRVENSPDSGRVLADATSYRIFGRTALLASGTGDQPRVLRLHDLATGKDVWKKEYDAKSIPLASPLNAAWTGVVKPDGTAEVVAVRTGEVVATLKIDAKNLEAHLKPAVGAQVLADADRFYLFLDRDPTAASTTGVRPVQVYNNYMLRSQKVNGPLYAFDRATGKRLWLYEGLFEHQWVVLEQFNELPVLIATAPVMNQNNSYSHAVVVIEKERGRLIFDKPVLYNGNLFQNLAVDPKAGTISMNRYDTRIVVSADEKGEKK